MPLQINVEPCAFLIYQHGAENFARSKACGAFCLGKNQNRYAYEVAKDGHQEI